jgi:hypothetical protein
MRVEKGGGDSKYAICCCSKSMGIIAKIILIKYFIFVKCQFLNHFEHMALRVYFTLE